MPPSGSGRNELLVSAYEQLLFDSLDWFLVVFVLLVQDLDSALLGPRTPGQTAGQTGQLWTSSQPPLCASCSTSHLLWEA